MPPFEYNILAGRMPLKNHIDVAKQSSSQHVHFPVATLFGRRSVVAQRAGDVILLHVLFERDRGERRSGSKQVMATAVAWRVGYHRAAVRRSGLRKAGKRVKFAQDRDHRRALAEAGDEGGGFIGYRRLHVKTGRFQFMPQQSRALFLLIAQFRVVPYGFGSRRKVRRVLVHEGQDFPMLRGRTCSVLAENQRGKQGRSCQCDAAGKRTRQCDVHSFSLLDRIK
jgi:hypothetical protein